MKKKINAALRRYLPKGSDNIEKAMRYTVLSGGKRIRPIIVLEASRICGGSIKDAMSAACAIEFIHTYSLIHDDLPAMDNDDFRRGKPACHKVFGEANAILAGDALLTLAFNIIAISMPAKSGLDIIKELSDAAGINGMVGGQAADMKFKEKRKDKIVSKKINLLKTARLFIASCKAGALAAGAKVNQIKALERFGRYFGAAFQVIDDRLDGEGSSIKEARSLIEKAKNELRVFGHKADTLRQIAEYSLNRTL